MRRRVPKDITVELISRIIDRQGAKREHLVPILDRWGDRRATGRVNVVHAEGQAAMEVRLALEMERVDFVQLAIPNAMTVFLVESPVPASVQHWAEWVPALPCLALALTLALINDRKAVLSLSDGYCRGSHQPLNWTGGGK